MYRKGCSISDITFFNPIPKKVYFVCFGVADEATTLFRATTLASTLMEQYMKATATPFVHHALKDSILKIMESKQSCEVMELNRTFSRGEKHKRLTVNIILHCASDLRAFCSPCPDVLCLVCLSQMRQHEVPSKAPALSKLAFVRFLLDGE